MIKYEYINIGFMSEAEIDLNASQKEALKILNKDIKKEMYNIGSGKKNTT